jgi:hypothetical protein
LFSARYGWLANCCKVRSSWRKESDVIKQLEQERTRLSSQLANLNEALLALGSTTKRRGRMSAAGRERIAAAQRARWAKAKGQKVVSIGGRKRRNISAAAIARIRAARWQSGGRTEDGVRKLRASPLLLKVRYFEIEYSTPGMALPHSKQQALSRDVINPQDGHILCDWSPATRGITLRFRRSNTVAKSEMSKPRKILVAFTGEDIILASSESAQSVAARSMSLAYSLKCLRWENFRWTGLGQRT